MAQQPREIKSLLNLTTNVSFDRFLINGGRLNKTLFEDVFGPNSTNLNKDIKNKLLAKEAGYLFYLYLRSRNPGPDLDVIYYCLTELEAAVCADSCSILVVYTLFLESGNNRYKECVKYLKQFIPDIIQALNMYNSKNSDNPLDLLFQNTYDLNDIDYLYDLIKANYFIYGETDLLDQTNQKLQTININNPDFDGPYQQYLANPNNNHLYRNVMGSKTVEDYVFATFSLLSGRLDVYNVISVKNPEVFLNLSDGLSWFLQNLVISECYYIVEKAINNLMTPGNGISEDNKLWIIDTLMVLLFEHVSNGMIHNPMFIKNIFNLSNKYIKSNGGVEMTIYVYKSLIYDFLKVKTINFYYKSPLLNELNGLDLRTNYARNGVHIAQ